jgi:hypothetical protein
MLCRERVRFLEDLEADGWQLEAPADDDFACLRCDHPKPAEERRLVEAWEISESLCVCWVEGHIPQDGLQ